MINKLLPYLKPHKLYIIPTSDGLKVFCSCIIILVIGLSYANNYAILFSFLLFSFLFISMFYTHYNLTQINYNSLYAENLFVKKPGKIDLYLETQNYFGSNYINCTLKLSDQTEITTNNSNLLAKKTTPISLVITPQKRGELSINKVLIDTMFPFNFFKVFEIFNLGSKLLIYPESKESKICQVLPVVDLSASEQDEIKIRSFNQNDSLKRVYWKKLAQTQKWYTLENLSQENDPVIFFYKGNATEEAISDMTFLILKHESTNTPYGINLNEKLIIAPGSGDEHFHHCLKELATYAS